MISVPTPRRFGAGVAGLFALASLGAAVLSSVPAHAGDVSRLEKQMGIVEEAIDDMLIDSPNFLVSGRGVTQSIDDDQSGVLFIFEASLTGPHWESGRRNGFLSWLDGDSPRVYVLRDGDGDDDKVIDLDQGEIRIKHGEVTIKEKGGKERKLDGDGDWKRLDRKTIGERQLAKYGRGKEEVVRVLLDYGEILKAVPAGQSVRVVARLSDLDLPEGEEVRKLSVKAKIEDLRAYGDGKLTETEMRSRLEIRES